MSVRLEYVPVGTLAKFRTVEKSISCAKSTVMDFPCERRETGVPPACGVKVAPVMVTKKDMTSHTGASFPKRVTEPRLAVVELRLELLDVVELLDILAGLLPPQPASIRIILPIPSQAKTSR